MLDLFSLFARINYHTTDHLKQTQSRSLTIKEARSQASVSLGGNQGVGMTQFVGEDALSLAPSSLW